MKLKRRDFVLGGLSAFGFAILGRTMGGLSHETTDIDWGRISVPVEPPLLRFVAVADTGAGNSGQYAIARAMTLYHEQNPFDLVVLAGDNIYNNGEIEKIGPAFEQPYRELLDAGVEFRACLGNHDIRTNNGDAQVSYPGFHMQGRYYTFRRESVQFFALDTNKNADWNNQFPWLEEELSRSDAQWKVIFGHHPLYTSGIHRSDRGLRRRLDPLFKQYHVPLYINGHNHNYERTQPIDRTTHITCGAGAKKRFVGRSNWTARSANKLSFAAIEIYRDQAIVTGIDEFNQAFDRGIIPLSSFS